MTKDFYEGAYWKSPEGRHIWEVRKLMAFILEISNEDTPYPFMTPLSNDTMKTPSFDDYYGWHVTWSTKSGQELTIEFESDTFFVYAFENEYENDIFKDLKYSFWHSLSANPDSADEEEKLLTSESLAAAKADAKAWLLEHREELKGKEGALDRLFNIYD